MRKIYVLLVIASALISSPLLAQPASKTTNLTGSRTSNANLKSSANSITSTLTTQLALTPAQEIKTKKAVHSYIMQKQTASAQRKTTLDANFAKLLKTIFTAAQYSTYLSLKPATNDPSKPLSKLFY